MPNSFYNSLPKQPNTLTTPTDNAIAKALAEWLVNTNAIQFKTELGNVNIYDFICQVQYDKQVICKALYVNKSIRDALIKNMPRIEVCKNTRDLASLYKDRIYTQQSPTLSQEDLFVSALLNLSVTTRAVTVKEYKQIVACDKSPRELISKNIVLNNPTQFTEDHVLGFSFCPNEVIIYTPNSTSYAEGILLDTKSFVALYENNLLNKIDYRRQTIVIDDMSLEVDRVPCIVIQTECGEEVRVLADYLHNSLVHKKSPYDLTTEYIGGR